MLITFNMASVWRKPEEGKNIYFQGTVPAAQCADVEGATTLSTAVVGGPVCHYYGKPFIFCWTQSQHVEYPHVDTADALCSFAWGGLGG